MGEPVVDAGPRRSMAPGNPAMAGAAIGTPIAVIGVWYLNSFVLPAPMPVEVSTAAGAVIALLVSYAAKVAGTLLARFNKEV